MTYRAKKLCRTLAVFLLSVLVLSLLVFVIARLAPGDPLVSYYGERAEKMSPPSARRQKQGWGWTSRLRSSI